MRWDNLFAARTARMKRSTIRKFLKLTNEPGMISFAGGLPASELLPVDAVQEAVASAMKKAGSRALQYGETEGVADLRAWIAADSSTADFRVNPEDVLITSGAQQALDLIGRVLLDPGNRVIVENPTYLAALSAWAPLDVEFVGVPGDDQGINMQALQSALNPRPKLLYLVPNFQNPQGTTLAIDRRHRVVELLAQHEIPMIEDDAYGELRYDGDDLPRIIRLHAAALGGRNGKVIYVSTFSKVLAPGFRIGWVIAPPDVLAKMAVAKQSMDLHTSTFSQYVVLELLRAGVVKDRLQTLRNVYRQRRDAMLAALAEHFPQGATWTRPEGGLFVFVHLPNGLSATDLIVKAIEQRVLFVPGADFHVDGSGENTMRLNFSRHGPDLIREGIQRLGAIVKEA